MSATNRGATRRTADDYPTPPWVTWRLLDRLWLPRTLWLEPAAGDGAIIRATDAHPSSATRRINWSAHEIRPECREPLEVAGATTTIGDFLAADYEPGEFDVIITNPPFSLAMEFLVKALALAPYVAMLLRVDFLGSKERAAFFRNEAPNIHQLPNRPSFAQSVSCSEKKTGCDFAVMLPLGVEVPRTCPKCGARTRVSSSDAIEYAWFVFPPERGRRRGVVEVLDDTPAADRRAIAQPKTVGGP